MVSPSPDLLKRIQNTKELIQLNNIQLISESIKNQPYNYIDINTYNKIYQLKPWIEKTKSSSKQLALQPLIHDNILVVCIDFIDKPAQLTTTDIYNKFFSNIYNSGKTFRNYYNENSYGKYVPEGSVHGWYRAPHLSTYYTNGNNGRGTYPNNSQKLVEDAINLVTQDLSINWSYIDNDGNYYIDYLIIIHSGSEAAYTGNPDDFWAHVNNISPLIKNGYLFEYYALCSEYISFPLETPVIGVYLHEFGHLLGLPDLYDYTGLSSGVGVFSLMGHGTWLDNGITPSHLDVWCKYYLGYITLIDNITGYITLNNIEQNNIAIRYYDINNTTEQFIIENRQNMLFDLYLPGNGLLIWKVNYSKTYNNDKTCYKVGLVQADGLNHLENNINYGDSGDYYPGTTINTILNEITNPNTVLCNGTTRKLSIYNISNSSNTMSFQVLIQCPIPICTLTVQ